MPASRPSGSCVFGSCALVRGLASLCACLLCLFACLGVSRRVSACVYPCSRVSAFVSAFVSACLRSGVKGAKASCPGSLVGGGHPFIEYTFVLGLRRRFSGVPGNVRVNSGILHRKQLVEGRVLQAAVPPYGSVASAVTSELRVAEPGRDVEGPAEMVSRFPCMAFLAPLSSRLKNESSLFSLTVRELTTQFRLLLTGTPLQVSQPVSVVCVCGVGTFPLLVKRPRRVWPVMSTAWADRPMQTSHSCHEIHLQIYLPLRFTGRCSVAQRLAYVDGPELEGRFSPAGTMMS